MRKRWLMQKTMGVILIALSVALLVMAYGQTSLQESDIGGVFITLPLGLLCLFSKRIFIV